MAHKLPYIFVISLEHSTDRRSRIGARLTELGLDFEFIDAVYGKKLTDQEISAGYNAFKRNVFFNKHMTLSEIGCLYSHRKACQAVIDRNLAHAIILEDDALLDDDVALVVEAVMSLSDKWDMIRFISREKAGADCRKVADVTSRHSLVRFRGTPGGAYGYLVSEQAARRLLESSTFAWMPLDIMQGHVWLTGLRTYGVWPSPIRCDDAIASTIGETRFARLNHASLVKACVYPFTRFAIKSWEFVLKRAYYYAGALIDRQRFRKG